MRMKFEDVDILDVLNQIVELNTHHYKDDFDLDKELIPKLAVSGNPEDRRLLWMSRPCGTYTLREREVYLQESYENNVWRFYHEQTKDKVLAYALVLKDLQDGKVTGDIYPLDYAAPVELVKLLTCAISKPTAAFGDAALVSVPYGNHKPLINGLASIHGKTKSVFYAPESGRELSAILERERFKRSYHARAGDMETYIAKLEKSTMRGRMKEAKNTVTKPDKGTPRKGVQER